MTTAAIKTGSWVIVTGGDYKGMRGEVRDVLRADRNYERRAVVKMSGSGIFMPMIRLDWLALDRDREATA